MQRRNFIKISALASGGILFGFDVNALTNETLVFNPNLFIEITSSNVITLKILEQEMGQGIGTTLVMLLAEELEVDIDQVETEFMPYTKDIPNYDTRYGNGNSGGSYATIQQWEAMRKAGATAREILINAAAKKWNTTSPNCKAEKGFVINANTQEKYSYGELCKDAIQEEIPENIVLKDYSQFKTIGKATPDIKNKKLVRGQLKYSFDEEVPKMVYASLIMTPSKEARLLDYPREKIMAADGIFDVFEIKSTPHDHDFNGSKGGLAIIGNSTWNVFKTKEAFAKDLTWDFGEYANKSFAALKEDFYTALKKPMDQGFQRGNIEESFKNEIVNETSAKYEAPYLAHALMEPLNAIVYAKENSCEIWAGTQSPQYTSYYIAQILNIPLKNFVFHTYPSGGGFGRRYCTDFVTQAALISKKIGKPVKLCWMREDEIQHGRFQSLREENFRGGLDKDNEFVALHYKGISTASYGPGPNMIYHISNQKEEHRLLESIATDGTWRSVAAFHSILGRECFIDEMAYLAKSDPMQFRIKYLQKELDMVNTYNPYDNFVKFRKNQIPIYLKILKKLKTLSHWGTQLPKNEGLGLAISDYGSRGENTGFRNSVCGQVAHIKVSEGTWEIKKVIAVVDCGLVVNPSGAKAQVEGSINWVLSPIIYDGIDIMNGEVVQSNFHDFQVLRIESAPEIDIHFLPSTDHPNGMGEIAVPPATPAILNGIYAACGKRIRKIPIKELTYKYV